MEEHEIVRTLMTEFAERTGLVTGGATRRYLWTDAFAVGNFLGLYRMSGEESDLELARRLVDQVHHVLGRHREDDPRKGWISGLGEAEGERHPTAGGLRIGKERNERGAGEPFDERLEWERDGQYYHYLTKWMHALGRVSAVTGDPIPLCWAMELAKTAHARFTDTPTAGGRKRLYWKMSIDLTRPLVPSMGQHDPLDGFITCRALQAAATRDFPDSPLPDLSVEIAELAEICAGQRWSTDDPLGIGGLLHDGCRLMQLMDLSGDTELLEEVFDAALAGVEAFAVRSPFGLPASYRLPFRELGLAIGLKGIARLTAQNPDLVAGHGAMARRLTALARHASLGEKIDDFWGDPGNREGESWVAHREINTVMMATSLAPEGFLGI